MSAELRHELLEIIMSSVEPDPLEIKSARREIYDWYQQTEMNKLSRRSLDDLILRRDWDPERIRMMIRRLSSANYELDDFISEYDRDYIEAMRARRAVQSARFEEIIRPFSPVTPRIELSSAEAFRIPLLSPRDSSSLVRWSIRSVISSSDEFPGLYGPRYGIDGLLLPESNRVVLVTR